MAANYVLLEKITVGAAGASSVTFSGIPQTGYTDLVVRFSARSNRSGNVTSPLRLYPNGSSTGITLKFVQGDGTSASSGTQSAFAAYIAEIPGSTATASTFGTNEIYIPNYTSSNYKSISAESATENNATLAIAQMFAYLWSDTAAITSLQILDGVGNFVQYSTFYLYGVAALGTTPVIVPYATGGDTIMTDGTYWYHSFISSGTFTPQKALSVDYLVVAGAGGGGNSNGGGGGAGGYKTATGFSCSSGTGLTVTVGAGGASATAGSNSVFSSITSTGGGRGAYESGNVATSGGSGGGGGYEVSTRTGASASPAGQGFAGGNGTSAGNPYQAGGGGGAGAVGGNAVGGDLGAAGSGGVGLQSSYSGASVYYSGGGGGGAFTSGSSPTRGVAGTGGTGGGGNGIAGFSSGTGTAGTANTGGGGGGGANNGIGGAGGSGIVLVRYAV